MHNVIFEVKASFAQSHIYGPQQLDKSLYYLVVRGANASGYSASYTPDGHYELHADASDASNILGQGTVSNFQIGDGFLNTIALVVQDTTVSLYVKLPAGDASDRSDH